MENKTDKELNELLSKIQLVSYVAMIEADALNIRDILVRDNNPILSEITADLEEAAAISRRLAEKLNIAVEVQTARQIQEENIAAINEQAKSKKDLANKSLDLVKQIMGGDPKKDLN